MIWTLLNIIIQSSACYLLIRALWFYRKRRKFTYQAGRLVRNNIDKDKYLKQIELDIDLVRYFEMTIWSFNKMYFRFWIWDFKKMVYIQEAFKEVEKFIKKSNNNVLLLKKKGIKNEEKTKCQQQKTTS